MDLAAARSGDAAAVARERARFNHAIQPLLQHEGPKLLVTDSQVGLCCALPPTLTHSLTHLLTHLLSYSHTHLNHSLRLKHFACVHPHSNGSLVSLATLQSVLWGCMMV